MDERWVGEMSTKVTDHERRLDGINGHVSEMAKALTEMRITLGRIAIGASILVVLANALVALVVYQLTVG